MSAAARAKMSASAKSRWRDPAYADSQRVFRIAAKSSHMQGAFSTNEVYEPPIDEFDTWEH